MIQVLTCWAQMPGACDRGHRQEREWPHRLCRRHEKGPPRLGTALTDVFENRCQMKKDLVIWPQPPALPPPLAGL